MEWVWTASRFCVALALASASPVAALDIERIEIAAGPNRVNGSEEPGGDYSIVASVFGQGITSVRVTSPTSISDFLVEVPGSGGTEFGGEDDEYPSLSAIRSVWGAGNYSFEFNGGVDSVELFFDPGSSDLFDGFPRIASPNPDETVPPRHLFTWTCAGASCGDGYIPSICQDSVCFSTLFREVIRDPNVLSWSPPGALPSLETLFFGIDAAQGTEVQRASHAGDSFVYASGFFSFNVTRFFVPEAGATTQLACALMLALWLGRRSHAAPVAKAPLQV